MVIPWVGFPLADFIKECEPTSRARFVEFTSLSDPKQMPGTRVLVLPWPYVEGLRMDEAMHPLTILVVGLYGEVLPNQNGAQGPFDWRAASHRPEMGRPIWRIPLACLDFAGHPPPSDIASQMYEVSMGNGPSAVRISRRSPGTKSTTS
jgi:hypothetical protein